MSEHDATYAPLLTEQLVVLKHRRADVAYLLKTSAAQDEAVVDAITNDLVGARLVIRAALSSHL